MKDVRQLFLVSLLLIVMLITLEISRSTGAQSLSGLARHVPSNLISRSKDNGRLDGTKLLSLSVALSPRNPAALTEFLNKLSDPTDPLYKKFLTQAQFAAQFGPNPQDIQSVSNYLKGLALQVEDVKGGLIRVTGTAAAIEKAFSVELHQFASADGRGVYSITSEPQVAAEYASKISGILGLNSFQVWKPRFSLRQATGRTLQAGTGPGGGLSPADILKAYSVSAAQTGAGQNIAVFELDGFVSSDITAYENFFGLSNPPAVQTVLIDGYDGTPGSGQPEVTLDIELAMAVAQKAANIYSYEGPNTEQGFLDVFNKIATDDLAQQVSSSWGSPENQSTQALLNSENTIFMQMAAQGQSVFSASGDSGADADGSTLSVLDPASQPYVVGVGGTTLSLNSDGTFKSESSWSLSGGGISRVWKIPSWQAGLGTTSNKGSTSMRMVPDVSADADPNTGYAIFTSGAWNVYGGTSCATPVWAAFNALVNQQRVAQGLGLIGFPNSAIYGVGTGTTYASAFHDVNDGSNNGNYPAVKGYDLATGWGSMVASVLGPVLAGAQAVPTAPTSLTVTAHNQVLTINWNAAAGAKSYAVYRAGSSLGPFTEVAANVAGVSYDDTGLTNGTTYFYYVTAIDSGGASGDSAVVSGAPALMVPRAPTDVEAQ